jgi:hypothetical protein
MPTVAGTKVVLTKYERKLVEDGQGAIAGIALMCRTKCTEVEANQAVDEYRKSRVQRTNPGYLGLVRI